jgi:VanZ family protein
MIPRRQPQLQQRVLCVAGAGIIIFALFHGGSQPAAAGFIVAPWDKLAHFAVYAVITVLLWLGARGRGRFTVVALVIAIGALDELHQAHVPGRTADVLDFLVDALAAAAAGTLMLWLEAARGRVLRAAQASGG